MLHSDQIFTGPVRIKLSLLYLLSGLKARVQRAVLPALESELREQEELQERFEREGAHTGASF